MRDGEGGLPGWARALAYIGLPGFIALYLLGAIPGLRSPITRIEQAVEAHDKEQSRALRMICRGVWRGDDQGQRECDK